MHNVLSKFLLVALATLLTGCAAATPAPTPTIVPTEPPTATATSVPPTATATPEPTATRTPVPPTATPVPPTATATPAPTATPLPTKSATPKPTKAVTVTPRATAVPKPVVNSGSGVSSTPSTLQKSIQQSFDATMAMIGLVNQMATGGAELCVPLIENYQGVHAAPQYDTGGQSASMQQAYAKYRHGIELVDSRAVMIQECGKGGGALGSNDRGVLMRVLQQATNSFGQALDLARPAANQLPAGTLLEAVERTRQAVASLGATLDRATGSGNSEMCEPILADFSAVEQAPTFDVAAQPSNVQTAYAVYRQAISDVLTKADSLASVCRHGGGSLTSNDYSRTRLALKNAEGMLINALSMLQQ